MSESKFTLDTSRWSFLTNHARALVCLSHDPEMLLRNVAETLAVSERSAYSIVSDLIEAGYVSKVKHGRRNHYVVDEGLSMDEELSTQQSIGALMTLLLEPRTPSVSP